MIRPIAKITDIMSALDKSEKGAVSAEWQILDSNTYVDDDIMDILPISSVHTSLFNKQDIEIDLCFDSPYIDPETSAYHRKRLMEAFRIAEHCGSYQKRDVAVVVHMKNFVMPVSDKEAAEFIWYLFENYPHCTLAIENTILLNDANILRSACECWCVPEFVKRMRIVLGREYGKRLFTVLDTCHALGTIRMQNLIRIYGHFPSCKDEIGELEKYFVENHGVCKILHFNNARNLGIVKSEHGVPFETKEDIPIFEKVVEFYNKYIPEADFVIEIQEKDYLDAVNFEMTVKQLQLLERKNKNGTSK